MGCFLYGCDFGKQTGSFWALRFPRWNNPAIAKWIPGGAPAFSQHFHSQAEQSFDMLSLGVHPTQLLMSLNGFVCFVILMLMFPKRKFSGQVLLSFLLYYSVTRFLVELLRGDAIRGTATMGLPLSTSQFVSVCIVVVAIPLWLWLRYRAKISSLSGTKKC